jgi:hypothetical protein
MSDYKLVIDTKFEEFEVRVQRDLANGYELVGGVAVTEDAKGTHTFVQALQRREPWWRRFGKW